ncbi:hypothetical protein KKG61_04260 [bacterium]|nr:hypothetical protein [bacterium]MBU1599302.1 hypothetical protein [bacterium]
MGRTNACPTGGTVTCADGTYTETGNKNLTWTGKHITVRSQNRATNCIIDCQYDGREFYFNNTGQNSSDLIQGFYDKKWEYWQWWRNLLLFFLPIHLKLHNLRE